MADSTIGNLNAYTTPIDTDVLPIVDVTSGITKKITVANVKAKISPDATVSVKGIAEITPAPASAGTPIALGANFATVSGTPLDNSSNKIMDGAAGEVLANKSTNATTDKASDTKYPSVKAITTYVDNSIIAERGVNFVVSASANLRTSDDASAATSATSYTKVKEILYNENSGTITTTLTSNCSDGAFTVYSRIYKNGVAFGTEHVNSTGGAVAYPENLVFSIGDLIQVYAYTSNGSHATQITNFRLSYDKALKYIANTVNL